MKFYLALGGAIVLQRCYYPYRPSSADIAISYWWCV